LSRPRGLARRDVGRQRHHVLLFEDVADGAVFQHRKNMGARKKHRVDTFRLIASYADPDDVRYDARDLLEETMSAFTRLLKDEEGMRMWNEFIEKDEKEQKRILSKIDRESKAKSDAGGPKKTEKKSSSTKGDNLRAHHPAYSAESCFSRMDRRFKKVLLKGRNVPYDFIEKAERRLRSFFTETPGATYAEELASRFKRFYLHATAQFLELRSQSVHGDTGEKMVHVTNHKTLFKPPDALLSEFLLSRLKHNGNVSCNEEGK